MSKVPHLLKSSALPDGEQQRLTKYASAHPKSALHRKGQHHDAAVLLVHGIGYQNHGETLAYFGKPVAHSVQTLLALNTDSVAASEENPAAEASARVRVEVIPDGDTFPPAAEVNPLSHHSELTYSLTIERTEYPADPVEESPQVEENSAQEEPTEASEPKESTKISLPKVELPKVELPKVELPKVELPKIELPKIELPKVELPNIDFPNIELPNLELPRLPQPKPRPVRTVTRRSLLFQEGFWRPRHYRPLKEHLPWLALVLPLFLMFCFYYERPGVTWRERAGHLLRSTARFVNVALWLVLAAMALMTFRDAFVASLGTPQGAFTGLAAVLGLGIVGWVLARRARELWALVKAIPTQLIQTATSPESRDLERIYARLDRQLDDLSSRSDAVGIIAHSQGGYLSYELLRRRAAAAFTDIGAELNRGFARVKKWMRTMHYGLYAVLLLMLSVLLNVASPASLSALTGLDTSRLHSEGFDRLVADAQQLREQAGSSDLLLWILVGIFVVEALLMMVLSPWTQRRLQRAFMMRKVDRTGQLSEFNPLPMVTALLGLDGEDEDAEDAEEHNLAGEKKQESKAGQSAVV